MALPHNNKALLHYKNIVEHRPDVLMNMSFIGLKNFYDFLTRTKSYLESDASVKRLAWIPGRCPFDEGGDLYVKEFWIELSEHPDRPNETEADVRAFLDENVKEIYEMTPKDALEIDAQSFYERIKFSPDNRIRILDRHPQTQQLCLERLPFEGSQLILRPNTRTVDCQLRAIRAIRNEPRRDHLPLLRLFESLDYAKWNQVKPASINDEDWLVLTDVERNGTVEQRRFVAISLNTPDFALLEGPPGSGKTTAICELILQLAKRNKRTLLCGSTHIAVDNVLERLMDKENLHRDSVIPVRIGDSRLVSEKAQRWQIDEFVKTEHERILNKLNRVKNPTASQTEFKNLLKQRNGVIERMVLETANLVCGTTIGILQHPDMRTRKGERRSSIEPKFDVLIIDEASKTPFQEFLVPALWAKRWIIVGDPKQLSPYVDEEAIAVNIEACLPGKGIRNSCIDTFLAANRDQPRQSRVAVVATTCNETKHIYSVQCEEHDVDIADADQENRSDLWAASIVIGKEESLLKRVDELPLDVTSVRDSNDALPTIQRRAAAWQRRINQVQREQKTWASEVAWRTTRLYELRLTEKPSSQGGHRKNDRISRPQRLNSDINKLLPVSKLKEHRERCLKCIKEVQRVAFPSVLESLRDGFERSKGQKSGTALSDGLPDDVRKQRHVLLSTQHRMHPEIAEFSHHYIYDSRALKTPEYMKRERTWHYFAYSYRSIWIHVPSQHNFRNNRNTAEANQVIKELRRFDEWAMSKQRDRDVAWEVAVLTFYRGQEREIREHLRKWTKLKAMRHFYRGKKSSPYLKIELCTVDRFQGHEADFVLISFVNHRPTSFLESPNRLNVALTRARYQRVAIGDRKAMAKGDSDGVLQKFAKNEPWAYPIERKNSMMAIKYE